jgi:hypothetical protein
MIVYGERHELVDPRRRLTELRDEVREVVGAGPAGEAGGADLHDRVVGLLIGLGELEAGIVDRICAEADGPEPLERALRAAAIQMGHALRSSWGDDTEGRTAWLARLASSLAELEGRRYPAEIEVRVQEGYAYYALYPETYLEAAAEFAREVGPGAVVCIGVRSIGTGLSAVVAAGLEAAGCVVQSYTVRPRGHPFDRRLACSAEFEAALREISGAHFVVVDEGPGLSGSSLACVAEWLSTLGVPDSRIAFFPSWRTDGSGLLSPTARARWPRHRQYTVSFETSWLESGRLGRGLPAGRLRDLSAGRWRELLYQHEAEYPAVQPQHERRKYLLVPGDGAGGGAGPMLLKFSSLGRYARGRLERMELLAAAGFAPPALGLASGFMVMEFIAGRPLRAGEVGESFLELLARYLAFRRCTFPTARPVPFDELLGMIRTNVAEGLGAGWLARLESLETLRGAALGRGTVAIDGRILPHKWLLTATGFRKVDGVDHHDDHFFPGCQDIAWDLAGAMVEFGLSNGARDYLVERYSEMTGDRGVSRVLPFYCLAYLAFRLGYVSVGAVAVGAGTAEGLRLQRAAKGYGVELRREITGVGIGRVSSQSVSPARCARTE